MEPRTINNQNHLRKCGRLFTQFFSSAVLGSLPPVLIPWKNLALLAVTRNYRDSLVVYLTLRASVASKSLTEAWTNKRFRAGVFIFLLALPSWKLHRLFDVNVRSEEWYFQNWAFFLHNIKAFLILFFITVGAFIASPQKWSFRWWALPVAFFAITEIYDRYSYNDYLDFQQEMPDWRMWGIIAVCIPAFLFSLDYLAYRKYHLKDGTAARILGVLRTPGIPAEQKMDLMERLAQEAEQYNSRI